jgi:hypothetical protein
MTTMVRVTHRGGPKRLGVVVKDTSGKDIQAFVLPAKGDECDTYVYEGNFLLVGEITDPVPSDDDAKQEEPVKATKKSKAVTKQDNEA